MTQFTLGSVDFELVPTFENLDKLEQVCNKSIYQIATNPKFSDAIKVVLACATPCHDAKKPQWFNADGIMKQASKENKTYDLCIAVVTFCTNVLTAGSDTNIKTVGATQDDEKK